MSNKNSKETKSPEQYEMKWSDLPPMKNLWQENQGKSDWGDYDDSHLLPENQGKNPWDSDYIQKKDK
jgi:hypothetical protein